MRLIFFDIEVYPNYFLVVFYDPYTKEYKVFHLWEVNDVVQVDDILSLREYLAEERNSFFVGYNSLAYDMNILTHIIAKRLTTNAQIKEFNDHLISETWPVYREEQLCSRTIDLMLINNYGIRSAKSTSLKKLEFNLRKKKIQDLPYHFNDIILKESQVDDIIKYCKFDVENTVDVFDKTKELLKMRIEFSDAHNINVLNSPEPDLAKKFVYKALAEYMGISEEKFKTLRTYHDTINASELVLPFITFEHDHYKEVLEFYKSLTLIASIQSIKDPSIKVINLKKQVSKTIVYDDLESVYGAGGIHAALPPGIYEENSEYMITTADFTSYYPHLQFLFDCIAAHIPSELYSKLVMFLFSERKTHEKGTALNYAYKILINLLYGLSNSEYSALYDTRATLKTTINGMLIISMIADRIYNIPGARVIMKNTDGLEVYHLRSDKEAVEKCMQDISALCGIPIEIGYYKKMVIRDVNNYLSIDVNDVIKTKGVFEDYEDIMRAGAYHKDTSAMVVSKALKEYFIKGIPVEDTVNNENSIYEFCYGNKGSSMYRWMTSKYDPSIGVIKSSLFDSRFVRYYAGGLTTLSQLWVKGARKGGIQAVQAQTPITMLMNVPKTEILDLDKKGNHKPRLNKDGEIVYRYPYLNKEWYINECYKIIELIEPVEII